MDLDKLAESFSSDVINEAISEIIAEEDLKDGDEDKWYRHAQDVTPPITGDTFSRVSEISEDMSQTEASPETQSDQSVDMEKVSPIVEHVGRPTSAGSGPRSLSTEMYHVDPLPTSQFLKDVPGYISPESRSKMLGRESAAVAAAVDSDKTGSAVHSQSEDTLHTLRYDERQDTLDEDETCATRKSSFSANDERSIKSTYSSNKSTYSNGKQRSEEFSSVYPGTSSVGSTTVFNSIAPDAFDHKRHLSPLIDMSEQSIELEKSLAEERKKSRPTIISDTSSKSSPRELSSHNSSRYQPSPREQHSRLSSATEYTALPPSLRDTKLSPNMSAQLVLSPDLAQRVSAILNLSPDNVPKLTFNETLKSKDGSVSSSPRYRDGDKQHISTDSGSRTSQDELDRHVSEVLSRSESYLSSQKKSKEPHSDVNDKDHSYLDKYISPSRTSPPYTDSHMHSSHGTHDVLNPVADDHWRKSTTPRYGRDTTPRSRTTTPLSSRSEASADGINKRYMDKSSRQVLEQAAKEYYTDLKKVSTAADVSVDDTLSQSRMNTTSNTNEELRNLADDSHSPGELTRSRPAAYTKISSSTQRDFFRPNKLPTAPVSEEETQTLVSKRLDRIEFMVLSALNEVPPQHKINYDDAASGALDTQPQHVPHSPDAIDHGRYNSADNLRSAIRSTAPRSPVERLPDYKLHEYSPPPRREEEESFNIGISPVKRDPFKTFNRAQELLSQRLAQRSSERTPGRQSTRPVASKSMSPTRDSIRPYPYPESRIEARAKNRGRHLGDLEKIPEPHTLEIKEAGSIPSHELVLQSKGKRRSSMSSADSVATTVESTHIGSDDAQPPQLPRDVMGTRKDPLTKSPGIYGTRVPKMGVKSAETMSKPKRQSDASEEEQERSKHSIVKRAERALIRGNEIREKMMERHQERKSRSSREDIQPTVDLSHTRAKSRSPKVSPRSEADTNRKARVDDPSSEMRDHQRGIGARSNSPPLDFYSSPINKRLGNRSFDSAHGDRPTMEGRSKPCEVTKAWAEEQHKDEVSSAERRKKLERGAELRDSLLERAAELKRRFAQNDLEISGRSISPTSQGRVHSPERGLMRLPLGSDPPSPADRSPTRYASRTDSPHRGSYRSNSYSPSRSRSPSARGPNLVRPLERVDYPDTQEFRTRLTHAVNDRLRTYHILREELMKAEDEVKGRELNLAWQRISKRKPKTPSVFEEIDATVDSTASSEVFDEERMKKLKSLLKNPLGHLVSKAKGSKSRNQGDKSTKTECKPAPKTNKLKYEKLMAKIEQQRKEESMLTETMSSTTVAASSDDTMCSRCERKRNAKRATKAYKPKPSQATDEEDEGGSLSSHTRPVTPTGVPVPHIKSAKQSYDYNRNNNQSERPIPAPRPTEKRLKDAAVMCPTPSTHVIEMEKSCPDVPNYPPQRGHSSESQALHEKHEVTKEKRNAFQKSRDLDDQQEGLVWFVPYSNPRPWTKSPRERKAFSVASEPWIPSNNKILTSSEKRTMNEISEALNEVNGKTSYVPTLQEAFRAQNQRFVSSSRERQRQIKLRADERQINKVHDEQRAQLFDIQPFSYQHGSQEKMKPITSSKRAIPKDEMYDRTNRMYRVLPEVKNKVKMSMRQQERMAYRIKAKLFNKKVQRHVLDQARVTNLVRNIKQPHNRA